MIFKCNNPEEQWIADQRRILMPQEKFTLTSGREVTVDYDENGEPQTISWMAGLQLVTLSENEVYEIVDTLDGENNDD